MLPHKKPDQSFISVPVSRVGSTQRLNQLPGNSNPSTPGAYISSSLNPNRNIPITWSNLRSRIKTPEQIRLFNQLSIVKKVSEFEKILTELASSISSFRDVDISVLVDNLIATNDSIVSEITVLNQHQQLGHQIEKLENDRNELDTEAKSILKELIACRAELKKLPRLPANRSNTSRDEMNDVDIQETLKYASKLAKFTKAPATTAGAPFQVHPNNYVWPAEDALRRGMLALASQKASLLIEKELGKDQVEPEETAGSKLEKEQSRPPSPKPRRGSFGSYSYAPKDGNDAAPEQPPKAAPALDLDLFDPDEDDDSD